MKIVKTFLIVLILGGIGMSLLNFSTMAYAVPNPDTLYGTTTLGDGALSEGFWRMAGRYLGNWGGNDWYCCQEARNCVIVYSTR